MTVMSSVLNLIGDLTALCDWFIKAQHMVYVQTAKGWTSRHVARSRICRRCRTAKLEVIEFSAAMLRNEVLNGGWERQGLAIMVRRCHALLRLSNHCGAGAFLSKGS